MDKPFDIVWFQTHHAEKAILSLAMLPGGEEERLTRWITHHYRGWRNVPAIKADGTIDAGLSWCVTTGIPGSDAIEPGETTDGIVLASRHCSSLEEVEPGFIGGYLKKEIWQLPKFIEAAKVCLIVEEEGRNKRDEFREKTVINISEARERAFRSYFETAASMILNEGAIPVEKMSLERLKSLTGMAVLSGCKICTMEAWMNEWVPEQDEQEQKPYDPLSFLTHGQAILEASKDLSNR